MKFVITTAVTALVAFAMGLFLPWYSIALAAGLVAALLPQNAWKAFATGFLGIALLWLAVALYKDAGNNHLLSTKIASLLKLPAYSYLFLVTAVVGGLVGGLGALTGYFARALKN
jgi:hypothetical protein